MLYLLELFGDDSNGRKMIAWGRRIGCRDAGHRFDAATRQICTRLIADSDNETHFRYILELVDNPTGLHSIDALDTDAPR